MEKRDITLLAEQGVPMDFIVTSAAKPNTWYLQIKRGLNVTTMTTTQGTNRVFRSLDTIQSFVCEELGRGFEVTYTPTTTL